MSAEVLTVDSLPSFAAKTRATAERGVRKAVFKFAGRESWVARQQANYLQDTRLP